MNRIALLTLWLMICSLATRGQKHLYTFSECQDIALAKNLQIGQSQISVASSKLAVYRTKGNQLPNLNFTGTQAGSFGRSVDPYTNQYVSQNIASNNFSLNSNWIIFNGLQVRNTIRQNDLSLSATELDLQKAKNDLSLNVAAAYLQVLLFYEQIDNLTIQVQNDSTQLDRTQKLLNGGKMTENDLLQSRAQLANDNYNLIQNENNLAVAKLTMEQLMELPESDSFDIERVKIDNPNIRDFGKPDQIFQTAQQLPEVQSAKLRSQSSQYAFKVAKGGLMPKLTLNGALTTGYSSANKLITTTSTHIIEPIGYLQKDPSSLVLANLPTTSTEKSNYTFGRQFKDNFSQQVNLTLLVPIFNNRSVKTNMEQAKLNIQSAKLNEDLVNINLRKSVEQAYTDVKSSEKQYGATTDQVNAAKSTYDNMKKRYDLGMATAIDMSLLQNNYTQAQILQVQAKYTYLFKAMILDFYMGRPMVINAQQ